MSLAAHKRAMVKHPDTNAPLRVYIRDGSVAAPHFAVRVQGAQEVLSVAEEGVIAGGCEQVVRALDQLGSKGRVLGEVDGVATDNVIRLG